MTSLFKLEQEEKTLKAKLEEIKTKKHIINKETYTHIHEIASILHEHLCTSDHVEQCDWVYDTGDWSAFSRKEWLKKANALVEFGSINFRSCTIEKIQSLLILLKK